MSNTLTQNVTAVSYSGATSVNATYGSALTNGTLLVAMGSDESGLGTMSVADNANAGNYTQDSYLAGGGGTGIGGAGIYSKQNAATSAATVTLTVTTLSNGFLKIYELSGAATSSALDVQNTSTGVLGTQSLSLTTATDHCSVFSIGTYYPSGAVADTNYTAAFTENGFATAYHFGEHRVDAGTAGAITLTYGFTGTQSWVMAAAAYKTNASAAVKRNNLMLAGVGR